MSVGRGAEIKAPTIRCLFTSCTVLFGAVQQTRSAPRQQARWSALSISLSVFETAVMDHDVRRATQSRLGRRGQDLHLCGSKFF